MGAIMMLTLICAISIGAVIYVKLTEKKHTAQR